MSVEGMIYPRRSLQQVQRDVREIARPFVSLKCDILAVNIPTMLLHPDGRMETNYAPEVVAHLAKIDAMYEEAVAQYLKDNVAEIAELEHP